RLSNLLLQVFRIRSQPGDSFTAASPLSATSRDTDSNGLDSVTLSPWWAIIHRRMPSDPRIIPPVHHPSVWLAAAGTVTTDPLTAVAIASMAKSSGSRKQPRPYRAYRQVRWYRARSP